MRELQNLMERAVLLAVGKDIVPAHFLLDPDNWPLFEEDESQAEQISAQPAENVSEQGSLSETEEKASEKNSVPVQTATANSVDFSGGLMPLHEVERLMIKKGLEVTQGNRTQAAELLGISVRTLRNKLNEYKSRRLIQTF